jgi:23S rRNA (guanosine2251-2'-O)-methyltransferase
MRRKAKNSARGNKHADLSARVRIGNEEHLRERVEACPLPFILILDGIQDPHNLGACLRTADAAGVDAVVVPKDRAVSLTDTVRKIACGAAESVPFFQVTNLVAVMKTRKEAGVWIVGTSDRAEKSLYELDMTCPTALVIGGEADGIRRLTADSCDFLASIPMSGKVPCLNASVAAGVALFEVVRQRMGKSEIGADSI